jgi:heme exporter protein C
VARSHGTTLVLLILATMALAVLLPVALHEDGDRSRAPGYAQMGDAGRLFYVHVPAAVAALLAFTVTFGGSIGFLLTRRAVYDRWAAASAEVGLLFTTIVLVTGSIWARAAWWTWWSWTEPRLTTSLILWFVYLGYLLVRAHAQDRERGARFSAVVGIAGFLVMPMVYWAGNLGVLHPQPETFSMDPEIRNVLLVGMVAMTLLGLLLLHLRVRLGLLEERIRACREAREDLDR